MLVGVMLYNNQTATSKVDAMRLVDWVVWDRSLGDHETSLWHLWLTLADNLDAILLGLDLGGIVLLDTVEELLTTAGGGDVLDTNVNTLGHDAATNLLVHDNTDGVWGDVEDNASATVVELVWHTLLDGRVGLDVDV